MTLGIFGGSFDPIHLGHQSIVNEALNSLDIDKLVIVPTFLSPFKTSFFLQPKKREELLKETFFSYEKVEICDYEIKQKKAVYSIETIKYLKNLYKPKKIYFIIGADNLKDLDKWHKIEEIKNLCEFIVAKRKGFEIKNKALKTLNINKDISSTSLRENFDIKYLPKQIKYKFKKR